MALLKAPFVLVVHENAAIRSLLQAILRHAGYGVLAVPTESEGARLLHHGQAGIRLLIVDQGRCLLPKRIGPDGSGRGNGIKVLYLTAFRGLAERVTDALAHPECGFLSKPFSPKALLDLVDALIGPPGRMPAALPAREAWSPQPESPAARPRTYA